MWTYSGRPGGAHVVAGGILPAVAQMSRRKRLLTDEEQALWNSVAEKLKPLKAEKKHVARSPSKSSPSRSGASLPNNAPPSMPMEASLALATHRIQRIRKVDIQARLDLHGLTREQAWLYLIRFLTSSQKHGYLWVLVITGKGRRNGNTQTPCGGTHARKTLRELVPQWLEEPTLRPVVSAYATAKPQDGGSGALYVRLKRMR